MAKQRRMRDDDSKPRRIPSNKIDHRLLSLLGMKRPQLDELKRRDQKRYERDIKELREFGEGCREERNARKRAALEAEYAERRTSMPVPLTFGVYFPEHAPKEVAGFTRLKVPFASVLIKATASATDLEDMGVQVRNQAGDIFTANVPLGSVRKLAAMESIDYIELGRPNQLDLGTAIPFAQIDQLHAAVPSVTGTNVIVGIVDSHFDVYHVDFRNNDGAGGDGNGSTRVLFLWHQWMPPQAGESGPPIAPALPGFNPTNGATYGTEYTQANIDAELNSFAPPTAAAPQPAYQIVRHAYGSTNSLINSHGTHVAGCAAGNGRSGNVGAAPDASIIYVQLGDDGNYISADQATLADAFAYVFARAAALGLPCVANRSGSDNMGPHDGTTLGEQFLDGLLLTAGRAITFAAGNTDALSAHIQGNVANAGTTTITLNYVAGDSDGDGVTDQPRNNDQIEIWYDGHDTFNVTLNIPDAAGTVIGPIGPGNSSAVTALANGNTVQVVHGQNDPRNGDNVITIFIANVSSASPIPAGAWSIQLAGTSVANGAFAAWVDRNNRGSAGNFRNWTGAVSGSMTIATPATSLRSIAVGADADATAPNLPASTAFTSAGPTRDGRVKPDIAANGSAVLAARSDDRNAAVAAALTSSKSGTSMAAPIVAGACACLFDCRGAALNWFDLKQILWDTAGTPAAGVPSNKQGFGFLQMATACGEPATAVDVWLRDHTNDTGLEPFTTDIAWLSPDIEVQDLAGNPVANPTHDPSNFINNLVEVTVRNRGTQTARNIQVFLFWADPATNLPFPSEWQATGMYTGDPNFVIESNVVVVPQLAANASTSVRFGWAPPAPGSNIRGDDHFCLLARLETEADPSNIGAGGWPVIRGSNNIALRNTNVVAAPANGDEAATAFFVLGSDDIDGLWVDVEKLGGNVILTLPVRALVYRDAKLVEEYGKRAPFGADCGTDPLRTKRISLKRRDIELRTGITGADALRIAHGTAEIHKSAKERLFIPMLNIGPRAKVPASLRVGQVEIGRDPGYVHVGQLSGGRRAGGVSLEIRRKLPTPRRLRSYLEKGKLVIKRTRR